MIIISYFQPKPGQRLLVLSLLSFLLLPLFMQPATAQYNQVPDSIEYQALVDLYNSTNGENWTNNTNWLNGETIEEMNAWYGIRTKNGDIASISLSTNKLTGSIPESIGSLRKLKYLYLDENNLSGLIPNSLSAMHDLLALFLKQNQLTGPIPTDIGNLSKLERLELRNNQLTGDIPESIGNISSLRNLFLNSNRLSGRIPKSIGNCSNLVYLHLQYNRLVGDIPASLGNLKKLAHFYASSNQLTGELPDSLGGMTNLLVFYLADNNLNGSLPSSLGNLKRIQRLVVSSNQLEGNVPAVINTLENLTDLSLYRNNFTSFPDFSSHPKKELMTVGISDNRIPLEDIEKNFSEAGKSVFSHFSYHSQSPLPADTLAFAPDETVILDTEDNAPHNRYQWQKLVNGSWSNIPETNESTYTITINESNSGSYRCRIANDWVTNLTIFSRTFVVQTTSEFWSVADGNWTTDRIWSTTKGGSPVTGYPHNGSKVYIVGNNVTLSDDITCGPLEVIVENREASLTVDGAEMIVHGEVKLKKATEGYPGNVKVVNGGKIMPVEILK